MMVSFHGGVPPLARRNLPPFALIFTWKPSLMGCHSVEASILDFGRVWTTFLPVKPSKKASSEAVRYRPWQPLSRMTLDLFCTNSTSQRAFREEPVRLCRTVSSSSSAIRYFLRWLLSLTALALLKNSIVEEGGTESEFRGGEMNAEEYL